MKTRSLPCLLAALLVAPSTAFTSLPLSTQSLILNNVRPRQSSSSTTTTAKQRKHDAGRRTSLLQSSTAPFVASSNETAAALRLTLSPERRAQLMLLFRSSFCALSSVSTWALVQRVGLTIVQASAIQGLLGCLLLPKSYAMAWFCGSFGGMSAQPAALDEATLLAVACSSVFYPFEQYKLALGRGGRLGLIAFLSNLVYCVIRKGPQATAGIAVDLVNQVRPTTAMGVAVVGALLTGLRVHSHNQKFGGMVETSPPLNQRLFKLGTQSAILMVLLNRLLAVGAHNGATASLGSWLGTFFATLVPSLVAWKSQYTIFPVALMGVMAGFLMPTMAPAVYMGGFIGMCSLPHFRTSKIIRAAALSAVLLQLGVLGGFGGRLGFLAYLGVNFAM